MAWSTCADCLHIEPLVVEHIVASACDRFVVPLLPRIVSDTVVSAVVTAVVQRLESADLDASAQRAIHEAAIAQSQGVTDATAARISREVSAQLSLPLLTDVQKHSLVEQVLALILGDTTLLQLSSRAAASVHQSVGRTLLDPAKRIELATRLNEAVDLPMLNEAQEQKLFETLVAALGRAIDSLFPSQLASALRGLDGAEIALLKETTTERLLERMPMPFLDALHLPPEKVSEIVGVGVAGIFSLVLETEAAAVTLLAPSERLAKLRRQEVDVRSELGMLERRARRARLAVERRLRDVEEQKRAVKRQRVRGWLWGHYDH